VPVALLIAAAVGAFVIGAAAGLVVARVTGNRHARSADDTEPSAPVLAPSVPQDRRLASLVLDSLATGVVVVDRSEQPVLVNTAARHMGVLQADRLAFAELTGVVRRATDERATIQAAIDLPLGRLGREPIAVAVTAVPFPDPTDPARTDGVALMLDDVTEARRLEAVRRDFVANVSHELKTPIGALTLLAEAVQEASDDPETVSRFAERMQREGVRLGRLVRELIELSRLQGAEPLPGTDEVPVARVIEEAVDRTRLAAEQTSVHIVWRCEDGLTVRGNERQLAMAVGNLLDNAVAYSPAETRVAVAARTVHAEDGGAAAEISVSDQGIGIADADLPRVFERFYRVDPARSRETGGTGLGLAIVKHIATNHGGSVSAWSAEGAGSTFTIRIPCVHSTERSSEAVALPDEPAGVPTLARGTW
jgi:two-component system, OmpR family, sensor histidine kinase SenX3